MDSSTAATGPSPAGKSQPLVQKLVGQFVQLRDRKRDLEKLHKEQLAPYNKVLDEIAANLLAFMQENGTDNLSTPSGTVYQIVKQNATIRDTAAFRQWVIGNAGYDLVDWRANAPAVFSFIEHNHGVAPPGVNASTYIKVGVRRPGEEE